MSYLISIKYAVFVFPIVAFLFTAPFILSQYHKYGSISFLKSVIIYLFIFYLISAYFLVILPLPKISEVSKLTTPRTQLIPFQFVTDFLEHTNFNLTNVKSYLPVLKESYFYIPLFNIFLTIPFGMFLRYYFKWDMKKTIISTFFLSLFFELTQLSGLYFIYPRSYRLFDIDDLLLNTLGGFLGFIVCKPFIKILPNIDEINMETKERGKSISGFRRTLAFSLDLFIFSLISIGSIIIVGDYFHLILIEFFTYYFLIPLVLNTSTCGEKFLNIQIVDYNGEKNMTRLLFRKSLFVLIYILAPFYISYLVFRVNDNYIREIYGLIFIGIVFVIYVISIIKYLFTSKEMFYEKISKTKRISTIK